MRNVLLILRTRMRIVDNHLSNIRQHLVIHLAAFLFMVLLLFAGGTAFFYYLFSRVSELEEFGILLMDRLVGMVMMTFFGMLVFSNLVITLSTTYISREIEYYMSLPVRHDSIFSFKLMESIFYSSWGFAILAIPFFLSFGLVRGASFWFYPGMFLLILPFLTIPASLGAILTMTLCAWLPARRTLKWSVALVFLGAAASIAIVRLTGVGSALFREDMQSFTQVLSMLRVASTLWSPHAWVSQGTLALIRGEGKEFAYWLAVLVSTALMLMQVCRWLAPVLYYQGWCLARDSSASRPGGGAPLGERIFNAIERWLSPLKPSTRALVLKDMKTFWRDPAQWSQLIILFGILFVYTANLRAVYYQSTPTTFLAHGVWKAVLTQFNLGATCFILSILTTRFVYPMLSLEGKQFWVIGLAPVPRTRIVWQKYWLCWGTCFTLTEALMLFSNWILRVPGPMCLLSSFTVLCISFGLTSLSVGLGATTPNFKEDNPARIANGLGGTLNVILSLSYISLILVLEIIPIYLASIYTFPPTQFYLYIVAPVVAVFLLIQSATIVIPMRIGLRRWNRMEF
ncbi:MAG TPA: hypothetical protein PLA90_09955 [Candidatus Sumerlaeota bacterium]|nr:hypothetical protein [Candidatus Sumerlaeota bacterium]HPS01854.1 hypothetical protein [Candidatus Sumerlaeota bacterium]